MTKIRKLKKGECKDIIEVTIQFENCEEKKLVIYFYIILLDILVFVLML